MIITNTFLNKQPHEITAYISPKHVEKQIDYMLVNGPFWRTVTNVEATFDIDLGSDHKALRLESKCLNKYKTKIVIGSSTVTPGKPERQLGNPHSKYENEH